MKTERNVTIFLKAFNVGAILTLLSLVGILMTSETLIHYLIVLVMILINGLVIGLVTQHLLYHMTVTRNMVYSFLQAKDKLPPKLLKMRDYNVHETLMMMAGIKMNLKRNLLCASCLMGLLVLSLMLPITYSLVKEAGVVWFTVLWSLFILGRATLRFIILMNNTRFLTLKMDQFFNQYEFNAHPVLK